MRKVRKRIIKLSTILSLFFLVISTNVSAMEIEPKAVTCCDNMRIAITTEESAGPVYGCTKHSKCTYFRVDVYKVKKCLNCKAIYYRTYDYSEERHTS